MKWKISNLTYQPFRIMIKEKEVIIPGRNSLLENFIIVEEVSNEAKNLVQKGFLKIKKIK